MNAVDDAVATLTIWHYLAMAAGVIVCGLCAWASFNWDKVKAIFNTELNKVNANKPTVPISNLATDDFGDGLQYLRALKAIYERQKIDPVRTRDLILEQIGLLYKISDAPIQPAVSAPAVTPVEAVK